MLTRRIEQGAVLGKIESLKQEDLMPIRDRAYLQIKEAILKGVYRPGERLIERQLAGDLGISRTPIREALLKLENHGFVKTVPRRGVVVSEISRDEILEVFDILASLEALAFRLAAEKMDKFTAKKFASMVRELDGLLSLGDEKWESVRSYTIDLQITVNEILYRAAKSPRLYEILKGLYDYIRAFANIGYEVPGRLKEAVLEHRRILEAVRNQEMDVVEDLARDHLANSKEAYLEAVQAQRTDEDLSSPGGQAGAMR
jgi:DNA-binding GntR family transcriptional regulator